ncbi:MAG TPA: excinuclease ABC subunit UvrA, partial [Gammaproteobacteria bacterium]|nr:excinuclease ABC subunit UvrA [Gammaproteobacteria bacterium]
MDTIRIRGARTHNLKNIDIDLPRDKLTVMTGLSGSGKSSLAFDTIYAEGQRRYVESLSSYARQFLSIMEKPDVDLIEGLSPAIAIEQKSTIHNPRSTVGTVTEIYDYLRLLFARAGEPRCPEHDTALDAQTVSQMVDQVISLPEGTRLLLLAPLVEARKGEHAQQLQDLRTQGFIRARIDGRITELDTLPQLDARKKHTIEVVVDRFSVRPDIHQRLAESFETALNAGKGRARIAFMDEPERSELIFSSQFSCPLCGYSLNELEPRIFSFNNPAGACPRCDGLGSIEFFDPGRIVQHPELSLPAGAIRGWDRRNTYYFQLITSLAQHYGFDLDTPFQALSEPVQQAILHGSGDEQIEFSYLDSRGRPTTRRHPFEGVVPNIQRRYRETQSNVVREELGKYLGTVTCPDCGGSRLRTEARHVFVSGMTLPRVAALPIDQALAFFAHLTLPGRRGQIADKIIHEIRQRLTFLVNVGLEYLTLERSAETLSGGEAQRIRLASQIGAGLVGVTYILDEPTIGLHQRDNKKLLDSVIQLRDLGNTIIMVEHDEESILCADHIVDMGPGA